MPYTDDYLTSQVLQQWAPKVSLARLTSKKGEPIDGFKREVLIPTGPSVPVPFIGRGLDVPSGSMYRATEDIRGIIYSNSGF